VNYSSDEHVCGHCVHGLVRVMRTDHSFHRKIIPLAISLNSTVYRGKSLLILRYAINRRKMNSPVHNIQYIVVIC